MYANSVVLKTKLYRYNVLKPIPNCYYLAFTLSYVEVFDTFVGEFGTGFGPTWLFLHTPIQFDQIYYLKMLSFLFQCVFLVSLSNSGIQGFTAVPGVKHLR